MSLGRHRRHGCSGSTGLRLSSERTVRALGFSPGAGARLAAPAREHVLAARFDHLAADERVHRLCLGLLDLQGV